MYESIILTYDISVETADKPANYFKSPIVYTLHTIVTRILSVVRKNQLLLPVSGFMNDLYLINDFR